MISLVAFSDATWATNKQNRKSVGGNCIFLGSSLVHSISREQNTIATSSAAAELTQIFYTAKNLEHLTMFITELNVKLQSVAILTDSITSVNTLEKPIQRKQKHLSIYIAYVKQLQDKLGLKLLYINRKFNIADIMVKQGVTKEFISMVKQLQEPFFWRHITLYSPFQSDSVHLKVDNGSN